MIANMPYVAVVALLIIGLYTIAFKRNLIKMVIGVILVQSGINLFLITLGYRNDGVAPIFTSAPEGIIIPEQMALPTPQALTLTSIVIGVAVLALMLSLVIHLYRHNKTLDAGKTRRLNDHE